MEQTSKYYLWSGHCKKIDSNDKNGLFHAINDKMIIEIMNYMNHVVFLECYHRWEIDICSVYLEY